MPARRVEYRLWQSHFGSECFPMVAHGWNAGNLHRIRLGPECPGRGGYINTLLGPERTGVLSRQKIRSARIF